MTRAPLAFRPAQVAALAVAAYLVPPRSLSATSATAPASLSRVRYPIGVYRRESDERDQISAVNSALEALASKILDDHVRHCVAGALASGDEADARVKTEELLEAVQRFARTR